MMLFRLGRRNVARVLPWEPLQFTCLTGWLRILGAFLLLFFPVAFLYSCSNFFALVYHQNFLSKKIFTNLCVVISVATTTTTTSAATQEK